MPLQEVEIVNKLGLHARASSKFTQLASQFQCEVWVSRNQRRVNAKSIMGVMMLAAECGSKLLLIADGVDEDYLLAEIKEMMENGFGE